MRSHHVKARRRACRDAESWRAKNSQVAEYTAQYVRSLRREGQPLRIAAYVPLADEPGAGFLLETLETDVDELWLPICMPDARLHWSRYAGPDSLHIPNPRLPVSEPVGPGIASADCLPRLDLVIVPALAIARDGYRLGKGAGFYDRAIAEARSYVSSQTESAASSMPELLGLVFASEVCDSVPHNHRDCAVDKIMTEMGVRNLS
ncbi:5-formyltetrahydrofolate cyclo-ligase [Corynebacterium propinquum]|uniref:5-formyltetrahydrofolate cyclo-ligase n=1 Tax=Corynebacterium propinquum TaxID=43769 RepID=UPI001FCA763E|nr:5-formyltetrahydrofolate cyclo-ligase [Corynebacterium propinquum]